MCVIHICLHKLTPEQCAWQNGVHNRTWALRSNVLQVPLLTSFMNVGKSLGPLVHQILHLNKNNKSYVVGLWQG